MGTLLSILINQQKFLQVNSYNNNNNKSTYLDPSMALKMNITEMLIIIKNHTKFSCNK